MDQPTTTPRRHLTQREVLVARYVAAVIKRHPRPDEAREWLDIDERLQLQRIACRA